MSKTTVFVIGDDHHGLTIAITNPPAVIHYDRDELQRIATAKNITPTQARAFVMNDLSIILRGVDLQDMQDNPQNFEDEARIKEQQHGATVAKYLRDGAQLYNVDFCMAYEMDADMVSRARRSVEPARTIVEALQRPSNVVAPPFNPTDPFPPAVAKPVPPPAPAKKAD